MKKLILICIIAILNVLAVNGCENLDFSLKGKTCGQIVKELEDAGFTFFDTLEGFPVYEGKFKSSSIYAVACGVDDDEYDAKSKCTMIHCMYRTEESWSYVYKKYSTFKKALIEVYGTTYYEIEEFEFPYNLLEKPTVYQSNKAYHEGKFVYKSYWYREELNLGIVLEIDSDGFVIIDIIDVELESDRFIRV